MRQLAIWSWLILVMLIAAVANPATEQKGQASQQRTLTGHVFNGANQPLSKAIVYLKNTKTLLITTYITESDGSYRFPALAPNVDYEVFAEYQGARSSTKTLSAFDDRKQPIITLRIRAK